MLPSVVSHVECYILALWYVALLRTGIEVVTKCVRPSQSTAVVSTEAGVWMEECVTVPSSRQWETAAR